MNFEAHGQLIPTGGGDRIPLIRGKITIGRRESCDVCLRYSNVSGIHCELYFSEGYWYVRDAGSTNHTKVNGQQVHHKKLLRPGDQVAVANHRFTIEYTMPIGEEAAVEYMAEEDIGVSLLEKAGLVKPKRSSDPFLRPTPSKPAKPQVSRHDDDDDFDDDDDDD